MNIVVLTFTHNDNYGASLQCYALTKYLMDRGHTVKQLYVPHLHQKKKKLIERTIERVRYIVGGILRHTFLKSRRQMNPDYVRFSMTKEEKVGYGAYQIERDALFNRFYEEYIPYFTDPCFTEEEIKRLGLKADLYIVGSDQVWNPLITRGQKKIFFFSFLPDNVKRISYAGCFGGSEKWNVDDVETQQIKSLLQKFSGISVRDNIAKNILKNVFKVESVNVLDPSFLLGASDYLKIAEKSNLNGKGCLFMDKFVINDRWLNAVKALSIRIGSKLIVNGEYLHLGGVEYSPQLPVEGWLKLLHSSDFVITDSFHCSVFCVIFKKQFITLPSYPGGEGRMIGFLEELGLQDRYFYSSEDLAKNSSRCEKPIDYNKVYEVLSSKIVSSKEYLNKFLDD